MTVQAISSPSNESVSHLIAGTHQEPHKVLGLHPCDDGKKAIRVWRPGAACIHLEFRGGSVEAERIADQGLFQLVVPADTRPSDYRLYYCDGRLAHDPFNFPSTVGETDQHLFAGGTHYQLYDVLGAHVTRNTGVAGTRFAVWAPSARRVSVVGNFNDWNGLTHPMLALGLSGIWELFLPAVGKGELYKFEIKTQSGDVLLKADPFSFAQELRPNSASIVTDSGQHQWSDSCWIAQRTRRDHHRLPMNIYEVHLGSWMQKNGDFVSYRTLAHKLATYCEEMSYTHVELLPVAEHPLDESWGYQVTGFYAPTARYGTIGDFQYFVDHLHNHGIGVIVDWVAGHFPADDFGLARFDGTWLYEHLDERERCHPHWHTHIFNLGRKEVANFLLANALFWCETLHVDGLRVDAVASMLYRDYGRKEGEWVPNASGGRENLEAIEFFRHFNSVLHERCPGVLTIAEESTSFPGITRAVSGGGLGFDLKWNMGWMNDTLCYFEKAHIDRQHHHNHLTFGQLYAYTERFVLTLSHDEVVHGKRSLLSKMPSDMWQKFANLRLLLSYMMCQPGKKLLFMSGEFGQWTEWDCTREIEWGLLSFPAHASLRLMLEELNKLYLQHPALWQRDSEEAGFQWVYFADKTNSVVSYLRKADDEELLCIHNFMPTYQGEYVVPLENVRAVRELFNSDAERYGGSGKNGAPIELVRNNSGRSVGVKTALAPLATAIYKVQF